MAWITPADVAARLGPTVPADDPVIAEQTAAAIATIQSSRAAAGWVDDPELVPSADVREATILQAMLLYRGRAARETQPSYTELSVPDEPTSAVERRIRRLARFPRPAVA